MIYWHSSGGPVFLSHQKTHPDRKSQISVVFWLYLPACGQNLDLQLCDQVYKPHKVPDNASWVADSSKDMDNKHNVDNSMFSNTAGSNNM
jgi:hypothetical protein